MNRKIRWGIWGAGAIADKVASDFSLAKDSVLHAVASRNEERARRFASRHGAPRSYGRLDALLIDPEIDAVYVSTPNQCHAQDSIACMEAGKAVLCEKPFALNASQAQRMIDTARRLKVFCMEAMWTRFLPAVIEAKRAIDAGDIGAVRMIQGNFAFPAPLRKDSRLFNLEMGGGAMLDIGIYPISLVHHLLGVPQSVSGRALLGSTGVDEQSSYQFSFNNGAMADTWSSLHVRGTNDFTVFGERGTLRLCNPFFGAHRLLVRTHQRPQAAPPAASSTEPGPLRRWLSTLNNTPVTKSLRRRFSPLMESFSRGRVRAFPFPGNGYQFEIMEVSRCLQEGLNESSVMPLADSLDVMRTMDTLRAQWGLVYPQEKTDTLICNE